MLKELKLPEISENVTSGDVLEILVNEGDTIEPDQSLLELETDKATFEVPSTDAGQVTEVLVKKGQTVNVGDAIVKIETDPQKQQKEIQKKKPAQKKTNSDEESATEKPLKEKPAKEEPAAKTNKVGPAATEDEQAKEIISGESQEAYASPIVKQLANDLSVDISQVNGSGEDERITEDDVKRYVREHISSKGYADDETAAVKRPLPDLSKYGPVRKEKVKGIRKAIAANLTKTWTTIPQVTHFDEADITSLEELRKELAEGKVGESLKITLTAFLVKAAAQMLGRIPKFNSGLDMTTWEIVYRDYCHISVAVATDRGLLVPTIRDADLKNLVEISKELTDVAEKTRSGKIKTEDMEGGCITVSNLGGIGGTGFTPIVNWPQVAIIGISRSHEGVELRDGLVYKRNVLPLSLSYDHRVIDGADAATFLRQYCEILERPLLLARGL